MTVHQHTPCEKHNGKEGALFCEDLRYGQRVRLPLEQIIIPEGVEIDEGNVARIYDSFLRFGLQIQPVVVDKDYRLVTGVHRVVAAKRLHQAGYAGWDAVEASVLAETIDVRGGKWVSFEEDVARKEVSPLAKFFFWHTEAEPLLKRSQQVQRSQLSVFARPVNVRAGMRGERGLLGFSLEENAKKITGLSLVSLRKIGEVVALAERGQGQLQQVALQMVEKLKEPGCAIDPLYRMLLQLQRQQVKEVKERGGKDGVAAGGGGDQFFYAGIHSVMVAAERLQKDFVRKVDRQQRFLPAAQEQLEGCLRALLQMCATVATAYQTVRSDVLIRPEEGEQEVFYEGVLSRLAAMFEMDMCQEKTLEEAGK